jgi:flagellar hook-basal body complex protein FliE
MDGSIWKHDVEECNEKPAKRASVRFIAMGVPSVQSAHRRWPPVRLARRSRRPRSSTMNVTLKPFDFAQAVARAGLATNGQPIANTKTVQGPGFQQALTNALSNVSKSQMDADEMQRQVQLDNPTVSLEQTMIAMQKAQIGFSATLQVRNKLVSAYSEIMNMQV